MKQMPSNYTSGYPFNQTFQAAPWMSNMPNIQQPYMAAQAAPKTGLTGLLQKFIPAGGNLTQTLDQLQNVLKMAHSFTPTLQQYGPLLKNLPGMLALMKEFNESDDDATDSSTDEAKKEDDEPSDLSDILAVEDDNQQQEHQVKIESNDQIRETSNHSKNLYRIETLADQNQTEYNKPKLYI
ncbi:VrrA/YqfQ family protein [Amphibacillus jilinensis]|uniref:VrrA/YqfQ family protein n=1 Tax=Amphibacillus jilinensis TaxID=1216008 RepID=UPI0002F34923